MEFEKIDWPLDGYEDVIIPKMMKIKQRFDSAALENPVEHLKTRIDEAYSKGAVRPLKGKRIGITAGSRGISNYKEIMRAIVEKLKQYGADPFIFPAMGSHAGGTAEAQKAYLEEMGITEEYVGAPILSSMESVSIGTQQEGLPVYFDKYASEADGIVLFHKVKPHPNFKGKHESGLLKMICIGAGKKKGAATFHTQGFENMDENMVKVSKVFLEKVNVVFAVGLVENARHAIARIEVIKAEEVIEKDAELLAFARTQMPKLLVRDIDVLVIDEIGKEISGAGFDPNIHGRVCETDETEFRAGAPDIKRIVLLDITDQTHGCASTMGAADIISLRFANKIDFASTYTNLMTSKLPTGARMPVYANDDRHAIKLGIISAFHADISNPKIVRIKNTLSMDEIEVSVAYLEELKNSPGIEIQSEPYELKFNKNDDLW
ncbi:MAG: DUF362 domain-containing protein [Synergistaceae bacterium]|jgi:hypothetical protein|nr:DUF362 domain-containing protein [Synergistaceae bacterium]